jgi:hypothetical protein
MKACPLEPVNAVNQIEKAFLCGHSENSQCAGNSKSFVARDRHSFAVVNKQKDRHEVQSRE